MVPSHGHILSNIRPNDKTEMISLANRRDTVAQMLIEMMHWRENRILSGLMIGDPTTPSTQASGAVDPEWRINVSIGSYVLEGIFRLEVNAQVDTNPLQLPVVIPVGGGMSVAVIITMNGLTYPQLDFVQGQPQATTQPVDVTDKEIQDYLSDPNNGYDSIQYVRVAMLKMVRTADTVVGQFVDNHWRDI